MAETGTRVLLPNPRLRRPSVARRPSRPGNTLPGERIRLGYWTGDEFVLVGATLVNLCRDGLLLIAEGSVPRDQTAWIRFDGPERTESATAAVVGTTPLRHGRCAVRLELGEDCPAGFYEATVARLARTR